MNEKSIKDRIKSINNFVNLCLKDLRKNEIEFDMSTISDSIDNVNDLYNSTMRSWILGEKEGKNELFISLLDSLIEDYYYNELKDNFDDKDFNKIYSIFKNNFEKVFSIYYSEKGNDMTSEKSLAKRALTAAADNAKSVAKKVVIRQAAKQYAKTFNVALVSMLKNYGLSHPLIINFLESSAGNFIPGMVLSYGVHALPISDEQKEFLSLVGEELQVSSAESAVEPIVQSLMEPLHGILASSITSLSLPGMPALSLPEKAESKPSAETKSTKTVKAKKSRAKTTKTNLHKVKTNDSEIKVKEIN
jgi:hypothetical protein